MSRRRLRPARGRARCVVRAAAWLGLLGALAATSACATLGVNPWEREQLARPEMQLDPRPLESAIDDHMYFSREASSGGRGFGGGGCGCN